MKPRANETFTAWFRRLKLRHFTAPEFTNYFKRWRRGVQNRAPARGKWANVVPVLRMVDDLRAATGAPIVILSSYRSPGYNAAVGGAKYSRHKEFDALDIASATHSPKQLYDILLKWRREGRFKGGLGLYSIFVHVDTRGYNANW